MLRLEGRAGFYDAAGALIDVMQSHLLQGCWRCSRWALRARSSPSTYAIDMRRMRRKVRLLRLRCGNHPDDWKAAMTTTDDHTIHAS
jgi:glucose-6-phosphate 1-dehydrogenase